MKPADAAGLPAKAQRVFDFAVLSAGCPDPVIVMNELFGASTPTPWTPTTARYRANVLEWARLLKAKGGHPLLLVSSEPFTGGDAGTWWRELVAGRGHRAREVLQRARGAHAPGPSSAAGGCARRCATRSPSSSRSACRPRSSASCWRFQTRRGSGGREGLEPAGAWFEVAKLQALAAKHDRPRASARLRRLVGLGLLQRAGARPGQARRWLRLALGARPVAVRGRRAARAVRPRSPRRADRPATRASAAHSAPPRSRRTRSRRSRA